MIIKEYHDQLYDATGSTWKSASKVAFPFNEYHTMHTFGNPRHTQSMIADIWFWLSISENSSERLHYGNVVNMPLLCIWCAALAAAGSVRVVGIVGFEL